MPTNTESLNRGLFRLLAKYKPKPLDAEGKATPIPDEADIFKFEFTKDRKDYGTVYVTLDEDRVLTVYFGDDVTKSPDGKTPGLDYNDTWSGLLHQLSAWRMTHGLKGFNTQNKDRVGDDMARRNHMRNKDKLAEGYYATGKKSSYSDAVPTVKIVIEHSRVIEEGEQRYRNINRIFLENQLGERYLLDTKKPGIARVYARHIAEGGKVNDDRWSHIGSLCEEYTKMAGFVRATRNGQFNESAQSLVNEGIAHYQSLRESLSRMTGKRGYNAYFESWTPALMEDGTEENNLNELFVQETLDPRIESVMPILNRIHKKVAESIVDKEMNKLAEWADGLTEAEGESLTSNNPIGIPEEDMSEATGDKRFDSTLANIIKGAKPNTPEKFIKDIKKVAKTKYKFQVGDWVTIDPNETAKWPTSGMIGRISRISPDGTAVVNVNPGGGASGGGSSGTHTSVPTSMLEKLAVNLDEQGVAEGSLNEFQDTSGKYGGGGGGGGGGDGQRQRIAKRLIKYAEKQGLRPGTIEVGYSSETGVYQVTGLAMNHNAEYDWRYKLDPYAKKLVAVDATQTDAEYAPDNFVPVVFDDVSESAGQGVAEDRVDSPVSGAITRRILNQRHDLLKFGPQAVMDAVDQVAEWVGEVEEIGSSDVSAWVAQVARYLQTQDGQGVAEGLPGEFAGGTVGGIAGNLIGTAIGGPIGGIVGGAVGGSGGGIIGRELTKEEQLNEFAPLLAAGARLVIAMAPKIAQVIKNAGMATAKAAGPVAKSGAEIAAKNAGQIGVGLGAYEIGTSVAEIAKEITSKVGTALEEKTVLDLANVAFKFAIPAGIVLAILYGGKKAIDSLFSDSKPSPGVAEDLDADQKRVGQLGPTSTVKNNNIGKLVGANENFINQADQAVVSEEDEMAESILSAIKKVGKKVLDTVAPGDEELLKQLDKDVHRGEVPNRYNSDEESAKKYPSSDELARILQIMKHRR